MKVSIGPTTLVGWGTSLLGFIPILTKLLSNGLDANHLGTPEQVSALVGIVSLGLTQIGRYLQAHAIVKAGK